MAGWRLDPSKLAGHVGWRGPPFFCFGSCISHLSCKRSLNFSPLAAGASQCCSSPAGFQKSHSGVVLVRAVARQGSRRGGVCAHQGPPAHLRAGKVCQLLQQPPAPLSAACGGTSSQGTPVLPACLLYSFNLASSAGLHEIAISSIADKMHFSLSSSSC